MRSMEGVLCGALRCGDTAQGSHALAQGKGKNTGRDDQEDEVTDESEPSGFLGWLWDTVKTWGPALLVVLLIRSVLAEPFRIPSGSMVPTLAIGDHILVTKYSYGLRIPLTRIPLGALKVPNRGDVVVFVYPGSDDDSMSYWLDLPFPPIATLDYVKRVVGLPGDVIEVRDNVLYLNGQAQEKRFIERYDFVDDRCRSHATKEYTEVLDGREHAILNATTFGMRAGDLPPTEVPEGHIFAMGDNRDHSADSRSWGFVPLRNLKGRARFVWLSYDQCQPGLPLLGTVRNDRFGEPVR